MPRKPTESRAPRQKTPKGYEIPKRPREHVLSDFRKVAVPPPDRGQKPA